MTLKNIVRVLAVHGMDSDWLITERATNVVAS
jgi:hypothetical protein